MKIPDGVWVVIFLLFMVSAIFTSAEQQYKDQQSTIKKDKITTCSQYRGEILGKYEVSTKANPKMFFETRVGSIQISSELYFDSKSVGDFFTECKFAYL